ncbi:HEAT repeat domain-containing protein [Chitinimonas sp. JJ19]|uniref:HEAT repeat domain-containing protein n=1 Tax=Chitinimonas sp. JJ19 TaxID=3109352 RepID=UPI003002C5D4
MNAPLQVDAIIQRHATDAAFYWSQCDGASRSPILTAERLQHFRYLLQAHLEGLQIAGEAGWKAAFKAFERWKGPSETFVCAWLALGEADGAKFKAIWPLVAEQPERMLRGVISALAQIGDEPAARCIGRWGLSTGFPVLQVAALRAAAHRSELGATTLQDLFALGQTSPDSHVQAASCRLARRLAGPAVVPSLTALLDTANYVVRAEAAIALLQHGNASAWQPLSKALQSRAATLPSLTGWQQSQAMHSLSRWVNYAGLHSTRNNTALLALRDSLPDRLALQLALYHGAANWLPWVRDHTNAGPHARYAGWVWQCLTGIDLEAHHLCLTPESNDLQEGDPQDVGLPLPAAARLPEALPLPQDVAVLLGQPVSPARLQQIIATAPCALAHLATLHQEFEA